MGAALALLAGCASILDIMDVPPLEDAEAGPDAMADTVSEPPPPLDCIPATGTAAPCEDAQTCCITHNPAGQMYCHGGTCPGNDFAFTCLSADYCPAGDVCCAQTDNGYFIIALTCTVAASCAGNNQVPLCGFSSIGACPAGLSCVESPYMGRQSSALPESSPFYWCKAPGD
jgi:hypothetical protein